MKKLLVVLLIFSSCSICPTKETPITALTSVKSRLSRGAPQRIGIDPIGIRKDKGWDCNAFMAPLLTLPFQIPIAWLHDGTFGTNDSCLVKVMNSGVMSAGRATLFNGTCITNNMCWAGDGLYGYSWARVEREAKTPNSALMQKICLRCRQLQDIFFRYLPQIKWYVSGILEHHLSRDAAITIANKIRECSASTTQVVDNPMNAYPDIPGVIKEKHSNVVAPLVSLDGTDAPDIDIEKYKSSNVGNVMTLIWDRSYNCRIQNGPPGQANLRRYCPTADRFWWMVRLIYPQGPKPPGKPTSCTQVIELHPPYIWKPKAEEYPYPPGGKPNVRDGKPVYITFFRSTNGVKALNWKGQQIGFLRAGGSFGSNMFRYYLGTGSGQTALQLNNAAESSSGYEWVFIPESNGKCFLINPLRRGGVMR